MAAAAAGLLLALLLQAPLDAALVAAIAGAAAAMIYRSREQSAPPAPTPVETAAPDLPHVASLLDAVEDPILIVRDSRVLIANAAARKVLGDHIQGVDTRLAIRHPAAADRLSEISGGEDARAVTRTELTGLGASDRRWEMVVSPLDDGSRLVRLNDRSEAHAAEQMRNDFVANASHELRTPLATVLGFLETLQDERAAQDGKTRTRFLKIMFDEARRMHRLVDDLISLSRIEAERFSLPRTPVALLPLVEEVRSGCAPMIAERQSAVLVEHGELLPTVLGDRSQLLQLLQNLVVNALKYGRAGSPVTVRFEEAGAEMLRMSVIDQGEGIAAEHLPRLTERFYRVDAGRSRSVGGTGLGLSIVKHIVGRHRGRLEIRSNPGEGTSVDVYLPAEPSSLSSKSH